MKRGNLNSAIYLMNKVGLKDDDLFKRISFMLDIKEHGFNKKISNKKKIYELNVLFAVHNSLPYDKAGYAIRTHTVAKNFLKHEINISMI